MSNVWISKESWERLWNAMHNVQIRFSRLLTHPSGGITGEGPTAQFRIDLPDRTQDPPRQWRYEITELENDTWQITFFSSPDTTKAGIVHYRKSFYNIYTNVCSFKVSKSDLSRTIRFILVKQTASTHAEGVTFVPRLTHMPAVSSGASTAQYVCIAEFTYSSSKNEPSVYVYHDQTVEWYDPSFYRNNQLHLDIAFGPTPASTDGFREFLDGAVQYLVFDKHFCMMVNGFVVHQNGESLTMYDMIAIDQYHEPNKSYMYIYWVCGISTGYNDLSGCNYPINPHFEFLPNQLTYSELSYYRNRQVHIPVLSLQWTAYPVQCDAAQSGLYRISDTVSPMNIPLYWINTFGLDFSPAVQDGWITIDFSDKKVVINSIRCYGNDTYIGLIPKQTISYQDRMPLDGSLTVCCVFNEENNRWGTPYLKNGNQNLTADNSGVTGRVCSVEIAKVQGLYPEYADIRQNYGGPVRLISYEYQINKLRSDLTLANSQIQNEIASLWSSLGSIDDRISNYHH